MNIINTTYGYSIKKGDWNLNIDVVTKDIVRFAYAKNEEMPKSTPAVVIKREEVKHGLNKNKIETEKFDIFIDEDLKVEILSKAGEVIVRDSSLNIEKLTVEKEMTWESGYYGMGEKYGWINKKGTNTVNWCTDVIGVAPVHTSLVDEYHTSIPYYLGLFKDKVYGVYYDNSFRTKFDFGRYSEGVKFEAEGGNLDWYFINGEKVSDIVKGYSKITGTMELPRKEFLGYQQCRWSYEDRKELMYIAKEMRNNNIPCDVLYLDIDYMENYKVFTVDSKKFNEFKEMNKTLKEMGFKVVVIIDPGVKVEEGYEVYDQGKEKDFFLKDKDGKIYVGEVWPGESAFPDFMREDVRTWWGELHRELIEDGVTGIWNDMNEPADMSTEEKTVPEYVYGVDEEGNKRTQAEMHNLYAMYEAMGTYEGLRSIKPNERPFILTRSAFAGTQRYSALWTGDNTSLWEHVEASMPMYLNLGLSGYSFVGGDVGGFLGDGNGELLARWTQLGAFTPLFRNHSVKDSIHQEPWCFGDEVLEATRKFIRVRYSFMTYMYNLMRESSLTGEPAMRPLFYHNQADERTYNINDQFMLGENLMVCPITRPGQDARMVYLPEGTWVNYFTEEIFEGGRYIVAHAKLDELPLYVKTGGIIVNDEVVNYIGEKNSYIDVHFYAGEEGKYEMYLDDGLTYEYEKEVYSIVEFNMTKTHVEASLKHSNYKVPVINAYVHNNGNITKYENVGSEFKLEI